MKKYIALLLLMGLAACGGQHNTTDDRASREELEREVAQRDSLLNDLFSSLNEISANLTEIKDREGIITANTSVEIGKEQRARIFEDIAAIDALLQQNRASLSRVQGTAEQLRRSNLKVQELETLIANFTKQIRDKDADIELLRLQLDSMHIQVAALNTEVTLMGEDRGSLAVKLDMQDEMIHTVYYIVGRERDLRDDGIITKSGFIGRTVKLNDGCDLGLFMQVDSRNLDRIMVGQRRATLVTSHPAGSYRLVVAENNLLQEIEIIDPVQFWATSKVLVVSYK